MTRRTQIAAQVLATSLALAACGGAASTAARAPAPSSPSAPPSGNTTEAEVPADGPVGVLAPPAPTGRSLLPPVSVVDVATGKALDFSTFAPAPSPILLWFWAPH